MHLATIASSHSVYRIKMHSLLLSSGLVFEHASGAEEAILHWSGKISGSFECMEKGQIPIDTQAL